MAPEYGATMGFFPIDSETLNYLRNTGRPEELVQRVEIYAKEQGLFRTESTPDPEYSDLLELNLESVEPALAGPKRPQDRIELPDASSSFQQTLAEFRDLRLVSSAGSTDPDGEIVPELEDGAVVIAAITSCTNTSNCKCCPERYQNKANESLISFGCFWGAQGFQLVFQLCSF